MKTIGRILSLAIVCAMLFAGMAVPGLAEAADGLREEFRSTSFKPCPVRKVYNR